LAGLIKRDIFLFQPLKEKYFDAYNHFRFLYFLLMLEGERGNNTFPSFDMNKMKNFRGVVLYASLILEKKNKISQELYISL